MKGWAFLIAALAWAQSPDMYPARGHVKGATVAAVALSPALVKAAFGSNLYKDYLVIEVAVFPDPNGSLNLSTKDFVLKTSEASSTSCRQRRRTTDTTRWTIPAKPEKLS